MWGRDEAEIWAHLEAWNQPIHRIRGRIEKIFGSWKGLRRMRWRELTKAGVQIRLTAIAYNIPDLPTKSNKSMQCASRTQVSQPGKFMAGRRMWSKPLK
ncbi:transposase [Mesorhizobium sp. YC-39]|uniref:transposase n=1 Tax=unclassified Mesorhizobium TaxID=325217 RepID=UPI00399594C7